MPSRLLTPSIITLRNSLVGETAGILFSFPLPLSFLCFLYKQSKYMHISWFLVFALTFGGVLAQQDQDRESSLPSPTPAASATSPSGSASPPASTGMTAATRSDETIVNSSSMTGTYSPSPSTFVLTHLPSSNAGSSSTYSSFHPSQSAPYPDDTIGKNGKLQVSPAPPLSYYSIPCLIVIFSTLWVLCHII